MLKMTIDNEEVISKNNFTIKEEMLSASSTILNNTYPKSWELDHDYISRFYYPKDYSKLTLNREVHILPEEGIRTTINGSATLPNVDTSKEDEYNFEGNTAQETTTGKNLFNLNATPSGGSGIGSITISDQTITLTRSVGASGTCYASFEMNVEQNTTYVVSGKVKITNNDLTQGSQLLVRTQRGSGTVLGTQLLNISSTTDQNINFTFNSGSNSKVYLWLYVDTGAESSSTGTRTYEAKQIQVEKGSTPTEYEKFTYGASPNPNYPQPIQVVTGNQEIEVYGKNLFSGLVKGYGINSTDGHQTTNSTGALSDYIPITINSSNSATISGLTNTLNSFIGAYNSNKQFLGRTGGGTRSSLTMYYNSFTSGTAQGTGEIAYIRVYQYYSSGNTGTIDDVDNLNIMLNKGNSALPYEPYTGNKYEINLGKNLFDISTIQSGYGNVTFNVNNNVLELTASGTTGSQYVKTIVSNFDSSKNYILSFKAKKIVKGTNGNPIIRVTIQGSNDGSTFTSLYNIDNNSPTQGTEYSFSQTVKGFKYYRFYFYNNTGNSVTVGEKTQYYDIQFEESTQATSFSPYFTPIELCKIGDYKDRIYKENDKWYIEKNIGKVVLNGSESWVKSTNYTNTTIYYWEHPLSDNYVATDFYMNYFKYQTGSDDIPHARWGGTNNIRLLIFSPILNSATNFKTWLIAHPTNLYYVMQTPTYTEITNEELISQLNSIELLDGLNNISITSANLPIIENLHYNFVTERTDITPIFNGIVKNTSNISMNPRKPKYCSLQILDYKTLLSEGKTLDFVIYNKTIPEAIEMVIDSISGYGFELGNINILNPNEVIGTYSTNEKTAYDVLQYLADISGAKWNCRRKDENTLYIDFYDPTLMPKGKTIEYTTEWACNNNLVDLKFNYGTRDYRNKQIILSDEVEGSIDYSERLSSDGISKEYLLPNKIASVKSIEVDGVEQSIATTEEKEVGIYANFYYSRNSDVITSNKALPYGTIIDVTYVPIIKGREVVQNDNEINRLATQLEVDGTISRFEKRNDTTDSNKLINIGETYLKYKGEAEITLTLKTHNNDIYNVGQSVYFNAPIPELRKDYLVKSKEINILASDENMFEVFYTYTLSSSFNAEKQINWFDNQRAKLEGNIGEGEFISRNIDINNNAIIIWDNLRVEEVDLPVGANNDLQATLESPFIH